MEVEIISQQCIKPSLPTPPHLKTFKLCLLDQLIPAPYAPIVLYYPNLDGPHHTHHKLLEKLLLLERSLSETLTRFYPLAGVIKDDISIECNDQGAYYVTAKVNRELHEFLDRPDLELISEFLPRKVSFSESLVGTHVASVQVNVFLCGGIAIGLCVSHKIVDGSGLSTFLRSWAGTACASKEIVFPSFIANSLFPTNDLWLRDASLAMWGSLFKSGKCVTKRFLFDSSAITRLKTIASNSHVRCPTKVEVVSACIWKSAIQSDSISDSDSIRPSLLTHVINLRKRAAPPFSEHALGNLIWIASAHTTTTTTISDIPDLVGEIRNSILKINDDYVKRMRSDQGWNLMRKSMKDIEDFGSKNHGADYLGFTSWCKIGFYEIDFGFGKPVWVSPTSSTGNRVFMNLIVLMETKSGNGIEAWITLDEEEMQRFEENQHLLGFAVPNSSPLEQFLV